MNYSLTDLKDVLLTHLGNLSALRTLRLRGVFCLDAYQISFLTCYLYARIGILVLVLPQT